MFSEHKNMTLTVDLDEELRSFVLHKVDQGEFKNFAEVIRAGIRLLKEIDEEQFSDNLDTRKRLLEKKYELETKHSDDLDEKLAKHFQLTTD